MIVFLAVLGFSITETNFHASFTEACFYMAFLMLSQYLYHFCYDGRSKSDHVNYIPISSNFKFGKMKKMEAGLVGDSRRTTKIKG